MLVDGLVTTTQDFFLAAPIPLDGVSWIAGEAFTVRITSDSGSGNKRTTVAVGIVTDAGPTPISVGSLFWSAGFPSALACAVSARVSPHCGKAIAVRITVTNTLDSGASGSFHTEITTTHPEDMLRLHFAYGYAPISNQERPVSDLTAMALNAAGTTDWQNHLFEKPVSAANLRFVRHTGFGTGGTGQVSSIVESQLALDDGEYLSLDDAYSPSIGMPPPASEAIRAACNTLLLDDGQQTILKNRTIIGWRWRGVQLGAGMSTFTPANPTLLVFFKDPPQCDSDGICEAGETCQTCPGDCPRPLGDIDRDCDHDLFDAALMQNDFTGPVPCVDE